MIYHREWVTRQNLAAAWDAGVTATAFRSSPPEPGQVCSTMDLAGLDPQFQREGLAWFSRGMFALNGVPEFGEEAAVKFFDIPREHAQRLFSDDCSLFLAADVDEFETPVDRLDVANVIEHYVATGGDLCHAERLRKQAA